MTPPIGLTIAATDSGGGAGLAADLATFAALGVHGTCVVTAVTAQDTTAVHAIHPVPLSVVEAQLDAVLNDLKPAVIKTGMLGTAEVARLVADRCRDRILVVDPVLRSSTGQQLADEQLIEAYRDVLIPVATVATPNEDEYEALGRPDLTNVLVTTGQPPAGRAAARVETGNDHGTGCTFASALAAHLALGAGVSEAAEQAHAFVARQLILSRTWNVGSGRGPVAHISTKSMTDYSGAPT